MNDIKLIDILHILKHDLIPTDCKVHFACWNGIKDPYEDVFLLGQWKEWQECQTKKNFTRPLIISLIQMRLKSEWMFAGVFQNNGVAQENNNRYYYNTSELSDFGALVGRMIVNYSKEYRQSYPYAENVMNDVLVSQLLSKRVQLKTFSSYDKVNLRYQELKHIIENQVPGWVEPLSAVCGVYLITDTENGKLYVGSAYGTGGIMNRWSVYANTQHGGNAKLKERIREHPSVVNGFQFSILETVDIKTAPEDLIAIENLWKERLGTRINGYNDN